MRFSYYKIANHTAPCSVVQCGALLLAVRCGYAILWAILVRFLWFVWFGEHPYLAQFKSLDPNLLLLQFVVEARC